MAEELKSRLNRAIDEMKKPSAERNHEFAAETFYESLNAVKPQYDNMKAELEIIKMPYEDENGEVWNTPTPYAYAQVCRALRTWKQRHQDILEILQSFGGSIKRAIEKHSF